MKTISLPVALGLIVVLVAIDQIVKSIVERSMELGQMIEVIPFLALLRAHMTALHFQCLAA